MSVIVQMIEDEKIHIQAESKYREDSVLAYRYQSEEKTKDQSEENSNDSRKKKKEKNIDIITTLDDGNKPYNIIHDRIDGPYCCTLRNHRRRFLIKKVIYLIIYSVLFCKFNVLFIYFLFYFYLFILYIYFCIIYSILFLVLIF